MNRAFSQISTWILGLLPLGLVLVAWQALGDPADAFFPAPSAWFDQIDWEGSAGLFAQVWASMTVLTLGVVLAFVLGFLLGVVCGRSPVLDALTSPLLEFVRAVPAPTIVPIIILFAGPGQATLVAAAAFAAIWPILLNTVESARTIEPVLIDSARTLRLSRSAWLRKIVVPACLPGAMVGVRSALPIALVVTLLAEMLTGAFGLGGALMQAQRGYATATAYGLLVVAGVVGLAITLVFRGFERSLLRVLSA